MTDVLRLCLDLNIWVTALLADIRGKQGTACQTIVGLIQQGNCLSQPVQLIISWGMLNRLRQVLTQKLQITTPTAQQYIDTIAAYAQLGAMDFSPQLTLGGTGVLPLRDREDSHVLETAIAGKAQILITVNFKDFLANDTEVIVPERHAIHTAPEHVCQIVHPYLFLTWVRQGQIPPIH